MPWKGNAPMPSCNAAHQQEILDAIAALRGAQRKAAEALVEEMGPKDLCVVLHAMRRWYSYNCWNAAKKIIPHRAALSEAMGLDPPIGVYRGFKVAAGSPLLDGLDEGDTIKLPVTRNGGCTSWTGRRDIANRFSGGGKGKVGLVVRLVGDKGLKPFIAPPEASRPFWNKLYETTMGTSFRNNEVEYAIYGRRIEVEILAIKRR